MMSRDLAIPAYIISLDAEILNSELSQSLVNAGFEPRFSQGVHGGSLPELAARLLTRNSWSVNHRGTLGCFIAHINSWEAIANGDADFALVVEDDVQIAGSLDPNVIAAIATTDIVFCNERTCFPGPKGLRSLQPVMQFVEGHGRAIGGEGYFLSRVGAAKILRYVETDSLFSHVDMRMLVYSLPLDWTETHDCCGLIASSVKVLQKEYSPTNRLVGLSLNPSLVRHMSTPSRRALIDMKFAVKEVNST